MKKILFVMTIALSMVTFACSGNVEKTSTKNAVESSQLQGKNENVNVDEFKKLAEAGMGTVLDVRTPDEWSSGIIEGATKINFFDKDFDVRAAHLDKTKPVYVYCKSGGRSGKAASKLSAMGYTVYNMLGGIGAWNSKGYKTVK